MKLDLKQVLKEHHAAQIRRACWLSPMTGTRADYSGRKTFSQPHGFNFSSQKVERDPTVIKANKSRLERSYARNWTTFAFFCPQSSKEGFFSSFTSSTLGILKAGKAPLGPGGFY